MRILDLIIENYQKQSGEPMAECKAYWEEAAKVAPATIKGDLLRELPPEELPVFRKKMRVHFNMLEAEYQFKLHTKN